MKYGAGRGAFILRNIYIIFTFKIIVNIHDSKCKNNSLGIVNREIC